MWNCVVEEKRHFNLSNLEVKGQWQSRYERGLQVNNGRLVEGQWLSSHWSVHAQSAGSLAAPHWPGRVTGAVLSRFRGRIGTEPPSNHLTKERVDLRKKNFSPRGQVRSRIYIYSVGEFKFGHVPKMGDEEKKWWWRGR